MAKQSKSPKKVTRSKTMEQTLKEGKEFLQSTKKKRIVKSRTILETITASKTILGKKTVVKKTVTKKAKRPTRPAVKSKPARKSIKAEPLPVSSQSKVVKTASVKKAIDPKSSVGKSGIIKSSSNDQIGKATQFKSKSKENLPLPAFGYIDVCFCVDATSSMSSQLAQVKSTIITLIQKLESKVQTQGITMRFAVVTYRDHPPQDNTYVTKIKDFTDDKEIIQYVGKLQAWGGGDFPEAVHDGLLDCCQKLTWVEISGTPILRYIFHIADAPPHGKEFNSNEQKEGCLCGLQNSDIFNAINMKQIHYRLIKARGHQLVNKMQEIFRKGIGNFDSADIKNAKEMDVRVSDMVIHEVLPDFA